MPRVTRRSLASKEESSSQEESPTKPTARRGRGAKREPEEDITEPQEVPSKRGRGRGVKAAEPVEDKAPKGRGKGRGGRAASARGRKAAAEEEVEDKEEEEEEEDEVKPAEEPVKRGGRRGKKAEEEEEEVKPVEAKGRGRGRPGRGKKTTEDEAESQSDPTDKGKAPKGGRRGRGRAAAKDEEEDSAPAQEEEAAVEEEMAEPKVTPSPRGRRGTPKQPTESPASGRRGRTPKSEDTPPAAPRAGRRGARGEQAEERGEPKLDDLKEEAEKDQVKANVEEEEPKDVKEKEVKNAAQEEAMEVEQPKQEEVKPPASDDDLDEDCKPSPPKKRKLEEPEEKVELPSAKRARTSETEDSSADKTELADFVVVNKEEVPAPDSKEVSEAIAGATKPAETATSSEDQEEERSEEAMPAPNLPFNVPLTEAELAKQYTNIHMERERDENSSTMVEVGSESASDITGVSARGLDVSDVTSMDSADQADQAPGEPSEAPQSETSMKEVAAEENNVPADLQSSSGPPSQSSQSSAAASPTPVTPAHNDVTPKTVPPAAPEKAQNGNGTLQSPPLTSTPAKVPPVTDTMPYVPSSTSILKRKFLPNPSFPIELMDPAFCFSVVTYNILADCHLRRYDYSFTEDEYLDQSYRHDLMMKELDYLAGDVVCLQEVGPAYYTNTLNPAMISRGYTGSFFKRTKAFNDEGEATFVKSSRFEVLESEGFSLTDLAHKEIDAAGLSEGVAAAAKNYLDRAEVMLLSKLVCKKTGKQLTICNIHVLYDPAAPDVACIQVASAIKELVCKAGNDLNPHIICGDFNSIVGSPGYQLAKDGYLNDTHIRDLQAIERMDNTDGSSRSIINHLWRAFQHTSSNLKSAYETAAGKEPKLTSYNNLTNAGLDYLFFSSASLHVTGVQEVLDREVAMATGGTPSKDIPSDHLSLKAIFRMK